MYLQVSTRLFDLTQDLGGVHWEGRREEGGMTVNVEKRKERNDGPEKGKEGRRCWRGEEVERGGRKKGVKAMRPLFVVIIVAVVIGSRTEHCRDVDEKTIRSTENKERL